MRTGIVAALCLALVGGPLWAKLPARRSSWGLGLLACASALWMALLSLEDRASLSDTLARRAEERGHSMSATRFRTDAEDMQASIEVLRKLLKSTIAVAVEGEEGDTRDDRG